MAYFLPSYFQKRLLRYALSRLDFLDSDALDLENLAFTIGQRSVVELKNVGIQVSKVVERLNLPAVIVPQHASIQVVRVTIPADLHVSGIEVEIDGVNIEVDLDLAKAQDEGRRANARASVAPSHKDIANQPRIPTTATHDPGGAHIIPSSQDLAASFLQAEPDEEKKELRAAVESRSGYLQQSSASLEGSATEAGYGMPEGFSLPGFVATFFAGVADRLSIRIRNVAVTLSTYIVNDHSGREPLQFVLHVDEVELQSLKSIMDTSGDRDLRRSVSVYGIEFLLSSQGDLLSQKSAVSSPKLSKGRSSTSNFSRQGSLLSTVAPGSNESRVLQESESPSNSTISSRTPLSGLGVEDSILGSSQLFDRSLAHSDYVSSAGSPERSRISHFEQQHRSDSAIRRLSHSSSDASDDQKFDTDELAQSKFFSHEDAESMYMSALSTTSSPIANMPGGLYSPPRATAQASSKNRSTSKNALIPIEEALVDAEISDVQASMRSSIDKPRSEEESRIEPSYLRRNHQCSKRLISINEIMLKFPLRPQDDNSALGRSEVALSTNLQENLGRSRVPQSARSAATSHNRNASEQSVYGIPEEQKVEIDDDVCYQLSLGDVEMALDISLCRVLLKSATQLSQVLAPSSSSPPKSAPATDADIHLKASLRSVALNLMESVPDYTTPRKQQIPTESTFSVRGEDLPLLQLQIFKAQTTAVIRHGKIDQKMSIHRFALYHESEKIVSFFDPATLQESFVASSVVLEPDDITIRHVNNRVDISTKPLRIAINLIVLDDVLSRSGGLSSLLELGNSVASTKDTESRRLPAYARQRSVRFDDTHTHSESLVQDDDGLKLNLRITGTIVDLIGSQSSMQVKSSSIKLAQRSGKFRVNVSSISIRGPILRRSSSNDFITLRFNDIQLMYLNMPEDEDLDRLLQLLAPSSEKYEQDDDIMVDTLLRQRRKGGVMRLSIKDIQFSVSGLAWAQRLARLGEEISKLSTVTKYLPEDDRPGVLTFALINKLTVRLELDPKFGPLILKTNLLEGAHISVPSLMAAQISSFSLSRDQSDVLLHELIPNMQESVLLGPPMLMCRFIADEMEPTVKVKLSNTCFEYSVPILLAITQLTETVQKELSQERQPLSPRASEISTTSSEASELSRKVKFSLALHTSAISLQPLGSPASALFVLSDAVLTHIAKHHTTLTTVEIKKASIMIVDDAAKIGHGISGADPKLYFDQNDQVQELVKAGFVPVGSISAAAADIKVVEEKITGKQYVDVEFRNSLLFLETCADSTQTLFQILGALSPPSVPSKTAKYRTEIIPLQDMLASFTGHSFVSERGPDLGLQVDEEAESTPTPSTILAQHTRNAETADSDDEDETFMNDLQVSQAEDEEGDQMTESSIISESSMLGSVHVGPINIMADDEPSMAGSIVMHSMLDLRDNHFVHKTSVGGTAHRWDSTRNTYGMGSEASVQQSPLKVRVRDVHVIWNLFDGYDWQNTRDVITQAVRDVEDKALAKQRRRDSHKSPSLEDEDESVVGDVLFNSIYISIPANRDPRELANAINMELGDAASETGSYATSTTITAASTKRYSTPGYKPKRLKLNRSKQHKMTFELEGVAADFFTFPPGSGEVESSTDIRIRKLEVFDHIPTSTWKKFATYMHEAGEREIGTDMVHIELLNVKPVAELEASEMVMKLTVLPLRLHVDQDALDFLTRFFEFKDDRTLPSTTPSTPPFLQRVEVNPIRLRLDFKPKRVDYAGLRSGRTTEFMNFFILDRSDMVLRRVILYGVSGFDRLGIMLNNIWSPDVRNNQLPGVLAGLAPVRSLVDVGSGVRNLVAVPIREYKKDGRIIRSIQKGALAFAKTTTTELVNLGAKLAIGTQTVLQSAEGLLAPQNKPQPGFESDSDDDENQKQISLYADQPLGIVQGLRGAYASLERDLLLAKDAIVAVPGEIMADGSATGAAKVILRQSPTIILRPAIGVTKAMGQAFLGAGNTLDKDNRRRMEDKYKRY